MGCGSSQATACHGFFISGSPLLTHREDDWAELGPPPPNFPDLSHFQETVESPPSVSGILFPQIYHLFRVEFSLFSTPN